MVRVVVGVLILVVTLIAAGLAAVRLEPVQDFVFKRMVTARTAPPAKNPFAEEGLHLVFCGTGSPIPDPQRSSACIAIIAGERMLLVDAGPGAWERVNAYRLPIGRLSGVLITHFHSDHIGGLDEIALNRWLAGAPGRLKAYGPPGVEAVAEGFTRAYALDAAYRAAHHGRDLLPPEAAGLEAVVVPIPGEEGRVVLDEEGLKVTAFRVDHAPIEPAYGYRVDYKGRAVIFSGDTVKHQNLVRFGTGADIMVHEALAPPMVLTLAEAIGAAGNPRRGKLLADTPSYHTTPVEAAELANAAGVELLLYSHIVPPLPNAFAESIFLRGVSKVRPKGVELADDGLHITLAAEDETIRKASLR